jgi:adenylate cyclase
MDILIIVLMGLLAELLLCRSKAVMGGVFTAALFFGYLALACFLFSSFRLPVNTVYPVFLLLIIYFSTTMYHYLVEEREKRRIKATFQHYLAPTVVEEILKDPENLKLGGEEQELTILFSDLRNFTSISEKLSPRQIEQLLNEYLTIMTDVIFTQNGTLDKYMGDAIMAFFGAPLKQPDHYLKACLTAVAMQQELNMLQQKWKQRGLPALDSGIGINTGPVVVGNMGSDVLFDYTVIGDNVNLASRLESLNKMYGTNIIIGENTHDHVKDAFRFRELDLVKVKGKETAVKIYELLREEDISIRWDEQFLKHSQEGLKRYRYREWSNALAAFEKALTLFPNDITTRLYITRCEMFKEDPPAADWDGFIKSP